MTHTDPMATSDGELTLEKELYKCRKCGETQAQCHVWESSCGGYEDYRYTCLACGHRWWVEGPDS